MTHFWIKWVIGAIISNATLDIMVVSYFRHTTPTLYGFFKSLLLVNKLSLPMKYRLFNGYFSIMLSWFGVALGLFMLVVRKYFTTSVDQP